MNKNRLFCARRSFLSSVAVGTTALMTPGVFADQLVQTLRQGEGPFYPNKMPLDTDNDLLLINDSITPAGRILDRRGEPVRGAVVEIWQADNNGAYLHTGSDNWDKRDTNFQGFGRFVTGSTGEYTFRTIKPVPYPGRQAPHIHFAVKVKGQDQFTTQCYVKGHPGNMRDGIYRGVRDAKALDSILVDFTPIKESRIGELAARFDIVLGYRVEG
jgi:protocatechuate 3,4-dioxygenase beta subunit